MATYPYGKASVRGGDRESAWGPGAPVGHTVWERPPSGVMGQHGVVRFDIRRS